MAAQNAKTLSRNTCSKDHPHSAINTICDCPATVILPTTAALVQGLASVFQLSKSGPSTPPTACSPQQDALGNKLQVATSSHLLARICCRQAYIGQCSGNGRGGPATTTASVAVYVVAGVLASYATAANQKPSIYVFFCTVQTTPMQGAPSYYCILFCISLKCDTPESKAPNKITLGR